MFHALVAEMMLQRTKAEQVEPVYLLFSNSYSDASSAASEPEKIRQLLMSLGLKWRADRMLELFTCLKGKKIPDEYEELIKLPGIGQYIASSFLSFHRGKRYPIIDTNSVRLWGRVFGFTYNNETRRKKFFKDIVEKLTPYKDFKEFNYGVLDLTGLICKFKPLCKQCPLKKNCSYYLNNS